MAIQLPLSIGLRVDSHFDNFFVTEKNQALINNLHDFFTAGEDTSLYIWGEHGCGITHLLQAVQHHYVNLNTQYLPLRELMAYSAHSICQGLETLDAVIIDNVECIAGKPEWEENLFYLFNRLTESGKKLLLGAHDAAQSLPLLLPDLHSRFQWGNVYFIHPLQDIEKRQVLIQRAKAIGLLLEPEVAQYIIQRCNRDMKSLMSALAVLDNESLSSQRSLTIPFVKQTLNL